MKMGKMDKKIVFLDVDGVLNCEEWLKAHKGEPYEEISLARVDRLQEIIRRTCAEVVLSSTWRHIPEHYSFSKLVSVLESREIKIHSFTPSHDDNRPFEISEWLRMNCSECSVKFVSLDDDFTEEDYAKHGIERHLVKTSFYGENGGLQAEHVEMAVKILNE